MALKRRIKNITVLQKYEQGLKTPAAVTKTYLMQQLNSEVFEYFMQMRAQHAVIHHRTIKLWAMQIKKRIDVHNQLQFKEELMFHNDDGSCQLVVVERNLCASDLCQLLALKNRVAKDMSWTIVEQWPELGLGERKKTFLK
ncbi:hypothetical protein ANN_16169 [Periplaneta americana]|uniref:Uncharacterized protein n=1 Tax=Periplaneta americana TaxID=6978 RepID=A0ABQ8SIC9_PERAM|nr:hypothetical protein ANN_16169 [Periplaneta americana]